MNTRLKNLRNNISARGGRNNYHNNTNRYNKRKNYQDDAECSMPQPKRGCFRPFGSFPRRNGRFTNIRWRADNPPRRDSWLSNNQQQVPGKYSANNRLKSLQQNLQNDRLQHLQSERSQTFQNEWQQNLQDEWQQNSQSEENAFNSNRTPIYDSDDSFNSSRSNRGSQSENRNNEQVRRNKPPNPFISSTVPNLLPRNPKLSPLKESIVTSPRVLKDDNFELPTTTYGLQDSLNRVCRNLMGSGSLKSLSSRSDEALSQTESKPKKEASMSPPNVAPWSLVSPAKIPQRKVASPTKIAPYCKPMSLEERLHRIRNSVMSKAKLDYTPPPKENSFQERLTRIEPVSKPTSILEDIWPWTSSANSDCTTSNNYTDKCEEMDWCAFDEKEVALELAEIRKNPDVASTAPKTSFQRAIAMEAAEIPFNDTLFKVIYIVVDTNVFLSHLEVVKKVMQLKINGVAQPTILVPWIVIQELDYIKDGKRKHKLKSKAQQAVHFINDSLTNKQNLKGQSVRDAAQQDFASSNFDDSILHCCLQIRDRRNRAILLTNDVNLQNKLLNEDFEAYSHSEVFKKLDPFNKSFPREETDISEDPKAVEMKTLLSHLCTLIILKELRSSYGELWNKMGSSKKTIPWSLKDCLDMFVQFWIPVFQMALSGQCLTHIETFKKSLETKNGKVESVERLFEFGLTLANFLKLGYPVHFAIIQDLIGNLQKIYDS